jgi:hypothetical protein
MKTILAAAAVLGFSVATASAGCAGHEATTSVDKKLTVASIQTPAPADDIKTEKDE